MPIDFRNETFDSIRGRLDADREFILQRFRIFGPCTTRQLAESLGMDVLSVRPRVTELCQMGAVELVDRHDHEGVYRARMEGDWMMWVAREIQRATSGEQMMLL